VTDKMKALERENRGLHQAYEIDEPAGYHLRKADPHDGLGQVGAEPA